MAVPIGKRGYNTAGLGTYIVIAVLVLSRPRDERQDILHIPDSKRNKHAGATLSAVPAYHMATDGNNGVLAVFPHIPGIAGGLITPYWIYAGWLLANNLHNPERALDFLSRFTEIQWTIDYGALTRPQTIYLALLVVMFLVGTIHFWFTSYMDKIRVRQIYTSLIMITLYTLVLLAVQPQMYNVLIYMLTIAVSPIIAHFVSLTHTRLSNIFFMVLMAIIFMLTGMNLWIS